MLNIEDKLKPCPYCNGELEITGGQPWNQRYYVLCKKCGHSWNYWYSRKEILDDWGIK